MFERAYQGSHQKRAQIYSKDYIAKIPDNKLEALKPMLADDSIIVDIDLSAEERAIIAEGREEYKKGNFILIDNIS